jgi:hypothetical protein
MSDKTSAALIQGAAIVIASVVLALGMVSLGNKIENASLRMSNITVGGKNTDGIPIRIQEVK